MKIALVIASLLAVAHHAWALVCPTTPVYTQEFKNLCTTEKDLKVLWPDYTNITRYYRCQGLNNHILENCFPNNVFNFYDQKCTKCNKYVPATPCEELDKKNCKPFTPNVITPEEKPVPFCDLPKYSTKFKPKCLGNDIYRLWPNYENLKQYYWCKAPYDAQIKTCTDEGTYFNYYAQSCTDCSKFVAAPDCKTVITAADKLNKCEDIK